jgi:hypothetical protein
MREKIGASVAFDNFITQILLYFFLSRSLLLSLAADGSWFLSEFTTGNSCNECHMCNYPPQSSKKLTNDLHLPQTSVCINECLMGAGKIKLVIDNRPKEGSGG